MPNSLIHESSPYLLQHAHNPVDWYAWNDETLAKAKKENKMLLISIGYAACHWCHVMEHESFENKEVAAVMNANYICIKVDREERPDVDQVYMDAAYLINGSGGWPLNALAMPDGKPFFAGTYYPRQNWIRILEYFADIYKNERSKLEEQAAHLSKGIETIEKVALNETPVFFTKKDLDEMFALFEKRIDRHKGGTVGNMKFAMPSVWEWVLNYYYFSKNEKALTALETTLQNMAQGGIYDHLGGGFSRYATDSEWHVPHFEKMLYDNAQLVSLYSNAFMVTQNKLYQKTVYETLDFVARELTSPEGGFYSSLDADSEGEEGKFYVWSEQEIKNILGEDADPYLNHYGFTTRGNWEYEKNIPDINYGKKNDQSGKRFSDKEWAALNNKLLAEREKRMRPATDDKILTSWNALMAKGFIDAYMAFGEEKFYEYAKKNIDFMLDSIWHVDDSLYRNYKNGKATVQAFLDDYAFLTSALIHFYEVSFEEKYLQKALTLTEYVLKHFWDKETGMFFYTNDLYSDLIARKKEITDNVIPASNSEMAKNLQLLSKYFEREDLETISSQMIKNIFDAARANAGYYSNWALAASSHIFPVIEIAVAGSKWKEKIQILQKNYIPNAIYSGGENGTLSLLKDKNIPGKTMIYVCKNKTCGLPVTETGEALQQILNYRS